VQASDAERGMMHVGSFPSAVPQDFPALHAGEDVLDTGADFAVRGVVFLLHVGNPFWPDSWRCGTTKPVPPVATVGDGGGRADGSFGFRFLPGPAAVSVAGQGLADNDDQAGCQRPV
jgi:hypothetical protein